MKRYRLAVVVGCFVAQASAAHHFFAPEYERELRGTIEGEVAGVRFANPHVAVDLRVRDASGGLTQWSANTVGPNALRYRGWSADTIKVGDYVVVEGFLGRGGARRIWIQSIVLPNGESIYPVGREVVE